MSKEELEKKSTENTEEKLELESSLETVERLSAEYRQGGEKKVKEVKTEAQEGTTLVKKEGGSEEQIQRAEGAEEKLATGAEEESGKLKTAIEAEALPIMAGGSGEVTGRKERVEKLKKEKYGVEEFTKEKLFFNVGKGALNTIGTTFGFRLGWEAPKLIYDHFKKKGQKEKLSEVIISLLKEAQKGPKAKEKVKAKETEERPVAKKIKELNERLKDAKMSPEDKKGLRSEYAQILKEYRHQGKNLEEARTEKTGRLLDLYINNSAQKMVVAREAVNTVSIMAMMPWLRLVGYSAFAGAERVVKAADSYEKKHFREKEGVGKKVSELGFVAKNLTVDAAKETFNGLTLNYFNKEQKGKIQKSMEFATSVFSVLRLAGIVGFEHQIQAGSLSMQEGAKKIWENLEKGDLVGVLKQGGENWVNNAERLLSYVGLAENPNQAMRALVSGEKSLAKPSGKSLLETMAEEKGKQQEALGREIAEKARGEYQEKLGREIVGAAQLEHIRKLATIGKGEGIEHAFIRQIENNPQTFGYKGDLNNAVEVHRFAQHNAHLEAIKNHFVNPKTGVETRALYDKNNLSEYILKPDGAVEKINPYEYTWKPHEETKKILDQIQETKDINKKIDELLAAGVPSEDITESDLGAEDFKRLTKEQIAAIKGANQEQLGREISERARGQYQEKLGKHIVEEAQKKLAGETIEERYISGLYQRFDGKILDSESGVKGTFNYTQDGKVTAVFLENRKPFEWDEPQKLLNNNWRELITNKFKNSQNLHQHAIEGRAITLWSYKKLLKTLEESEYGGGLSPESDFLRKKIKDLIESTEKQYGDVFKDIK